MLLTKYFTTGLRFVTFGPHREMAAWTSSMVLFEHRQPVLTTGSMASQHVLLTMPTPSASFAGSSWRTIGRVVSMSDSVRYGRITGSAGSSSTASGSETAASPAGALELLELFELLELLELLFESLESLELLELLELLRKHPFSPWRSSGKFNFRVSGNKSIRALTSGFMTIPVARDWISGRHEAPALITWPWHSWE